MSNPYTSPPPGATDQPSGGGYSATVQQVRIVAILLIVHGVLCLLMAGFYLLIAILFPQMMEGMQQVSPQQPEMPRWLAAIYYVMGIPALISGILQLVGGFYVFQFRKYTLGIIAAVACLLSVSTVYCGLTAVALTVYALVILLNATVRQAFQMRADGRDAQAVLAHFSYR